MIGKIWDGRDARDLLDLQKHGEGLLASHMQSNFGGTVYGGQFLAQGLMAATCFAPPQQRATSMTCDYVQAGRTEHAIIYSVEPLKIGGRYSVIQVVARQAGELLAYITCRFSARSEGPDHHASFPGSVAEHDALQELADFARANAHRLPDYSLNVYGRDRPILRKPVDPGSFFFHPSNEPAQILWMALPSAQNVLSLEQSLCLAAYLSDASMLATSMVSHFAVGATSDLAMATITHTVCLHTPPKLDGWLLHQIDSPWAGHGMGCSRGLLFNPDGTLIASSLQMGSTRIRGERRRE